MVRGRSTKIFYTIIYHTKISLHENFQMYGSVESQGGEQMYGSVESQGGEVVLSPLESCLLPIYPD